MVSKPSKPLPQPLPYEGRGANPPFPGREGGQGVRFIRASDVGRYAYCARAWWLTTVKGMPTEPTRLAAGTDAHLHHHRRIQRGVWQRQIGLAILALAFVLLIVLLLR